MLYEAIFLAIIIGIFTKGSIMNLAKIELISIPLVFVAFLLESGLDYFAYRGQTFSTIILVTTQCLTYVLLFIFLYRNRHFSGIKLMFLGMLLNFAVIIANSGAMPVNITGLDTDAASLVLQNKIATHTLISGQTKFPYLADIWLQTFPLKAKFSIGDVFISLGVFYLVWASMRVKTHRTFRMDSIIRRGKM